MVVLPELGLPVKAILMTDSSSFQKPSGLLLYSYLRLTNGRMILLRSFRQQGWIRMASASCRSMLYRPSLMDTTQLFFMRATTVTGSPV